MSKIFFAQDVFLKFSYFSLSSFLAFVNVVAVQNTLNKPEPGLKIRPICLNCQGVICDTVILFVSVTLGAVTFS